MDEKKENKKSKLFILFIVLFFIAGITVAYAAITSTLKIDGFGAIKNAKWSVRFDNLRPATLEGETKEVTKPTIQNNSTAIASYDVLFIRPGDGVTYTFDVVNDGDLNAELSNFTLGRPRCTGKDASTASNDERLVCSNLSYTITNNDGSPIDINGVLNVGQRRTMKVTLKFDGNDLPQNEVNISNLGISLIYTQRD